MDDDGSRTLSFDEFKKGISDYGILLKEDVSVIQNNTTCTCSSNVRWSKLNVTLLLSV